MGNPKPSIVRRSVPQGSNHAAPVSHSIDRRILSHIGHGHRRAGFSFIEVLFAVILLGIGFIMIAGVFSVGLQQTAATAQDTSATLITRDAVRMVQSIATNSVFPQTNGLVVPFMSSQTIVGSQQLNAIGESSFFSADHRLAWLGFYRRNAGDRFMQVMIIALLNENFPRYTISTSASPTPAPVYLPPPVPPSVLGQSPVAPTDATMTTVNLTYDVPSGNSFADIRYNGATGNNAVSGAYLLIANDPTAPSLTGRVLRLGNDLSTPSAANHFLLQPGLDLKDSNDAHMGVSVYIIGRAPLFNPTTNTYDGAFSGPNQDIGYLSTFVAIQPDVQIPMLISVPLPRSFFGGLLLVATVMVLQMRRHIRTRWNSRFG